jgi:predicted Zn-dependent protease
VLALAIGGIFLLWLLKDPLVELAASQIPVAVEEKIGETAFAQHTLGRKLLDSDEIQAAVEELIGPLVAAVGSERYEFECHVIEDATVNAFALPGGITVLHTGLIMKAESAEEILGVLAHEIAHVTEQHSMRGLIQAAGLTLVLSATFGDVGGLAGVLVNNSAFLMQMSFSRDHESEADEVGMEFLVKADIDPRGMVSFFERLRKLEQEAREEGGTELTIPGLELLSTHPATEERIAELEKAIDQLSKTSYQKSGFDLEAFQELVRKELE